MFHVNKKCLDEDYTLKLHSDTLHNETLFGLPDTTEKTGGMAFFLKTAER
jgi:hypothetical protein